ncbi:hypothetical protein CH63R_14556 [Colletotrichum higginsianum IMI 349063]|uniref:Uncharacterized protein n=1 Tax=Colletotrichum higginsianum (strain IMI 349063) TaxID=759273 RepID=A0A1B7XQH9_COLHI|nr:hypothetical protein CH63R_14556 [Colletotrichum higginsianum IMI 349063]OBR01984.1 hypothetical protein CH63R_14556 [Colletotrichum higginsianum IMI 349063]
MARVSQKKTNTSASPILPKQPPLVSSLDPGSNDTPLEPGCQPNTEPNLETNHETNHETNREPSRASITSEQPIIAAAGQAFSNVPAGQSQAGAAANGAPNTKSPICLTSRLLLMANEGSSDNDSDDGLYLEEDVDSDRHETPELGRGRRRPDKDCLASLNGGGSDSLNHSPDNSIQVNQDPDSSLLMPKTSSRPHPVRPKTYQTPLVEDENDEGVLYDEEDKGEDNDDDHDNHNDSNGKDEKHMANDATARHDHDASHTLTVTPDITTTGDQKLLQAIKQLRSGAMLTDNSVRALQTKMAKSIGLDSSIAIVGSSVFLPSPQYNRRPGCRHQCAGVSLHPCTPSSIIKARQSTNPMPSVPKLQSSLLPPTLLETKPSWTQAITQGTNVPLNTVPSQYRQRIRKRLSEQQLHSAPSVPSGGPSSRDTASGTTGVRTTIHYGVMYSTAAVPDPVFCTTAAYCTTSLVIITRRRHATQDGPRHNQGRQLRGPARCACQN